jgi:hypothetical protein
MLTKPLKHSSIQTVQDEQHIFTVWSETKQLSLQIALIKSYLHTGMKVVF